VIKQTQVYEQQTVSELQLSVQDAWWNTLSIDFVVVLGYGTCSEEKNTCGKITEDIR